MVEDRLRRRFDYYLGKTEIVIYSVLALLLAVTAFALRANISETLPVVVINEQGEEEKNKDEQEFSWCCLGGRGWRGTKRRRA